MLQAMRGILAENPDIRTIPGPDGSLYRGVSLRMTYSDDRPGSPSGYCQLTAWNEQADALARYGKGAEIEFIGHLNSNAFTDDHTPSLRFTLVHLDETKTLLSAVEKLFQDKYIPKPRLSEQIYSAEQQKARAENQQPDHLTKEAMP